MNTVAVLVVGGGASSVTGVTGNNGGGGAGAVKYDATHAVSIGAYSITVAASVTAGHHGNGSIFDTITAGGGGFGGQGSNFNGGAGDGANNGGSGGGGGGSNNNQAPGGYGTSTGGGNHGSDGFQNGLGGAGGGAGGTPPVNPSTTGGAPVSNTISGSPVNYGQGGYSNNSTSTFLSNSGNGGSSNGVSTPENGSSGIVIISYPVGTIVATGGTITTIGGNTIHTFYSNGTWTITAFITYNGDFFPFMNKKETFSS